MARPGPWGWCFAGADVPEFAVSVAFAIAHVALIVFMDIDHAATVLIGGGVIILLPNVLRWWFAWFSRARGFLGGAAG